MGQRGGDWLSDGDIFGRINEVNQRRAWLVNGWMTAVL